MSEVEHDFVSRFFSRLAYQLHPSLGRLYENHRKFFNDGIVEFICLIISTVSIGVLSYSVIGGALVLLSLCFVTPVTFAIKYFLHKLWVWAPNE